MANSKRKCPYCKERQKSDDMLIVGVQAFCNKDHYIEYQVANKSKLVEKGRKIQRADIKKRKEELRPIKWYEDRAQAIFNKYIRLRDKGKPCISCGKPDNGLHQRHASHYRSRGGCSYLRFDENNVHASCSQCNNWQSGNIAGYTPALIEKIGEAEFERIKTAPKSYKWSRDELIEIYEKYKLMCNNYNQT